MKNDKILCVIPARSGSKSIKDKNIQSIHGKPLIAFSIEDALKSKHINRIIVSTDSEYYAELARHYGAETPFLRPKEISMDHSTDIECFEHALNYLKHNEAYIPDIIVHLRPTTPFRNPKDIDAAIELLITNNYADSVRSVCLAKDTPYKMWEILDGKLVPAIKSNIKDHYNLARQVLPDVYIQNASIDITKPTTILEKHSMTGDIILPFIMDDIQDIDTYSDFENVKNLNKESTLKNKTFCFDIDGVIAGLSPNNDYSLAKPLTENIEIVNWLYLKGNIINLYTARGTVTKTDWSTVTKDQLSNWGVKYHNLLFGKPFYDFFIDDKNIDIEILRKKMQNEKR